MTDETITIHSEDGIALFEIKRTIERGHQITITSHQDRITVLEPYTDYDAQAGERIFKSEMVDLGKTEPFHLDIFLDYPTRFTIKDILFGIDEGKRVLDIVETALDDALNRPTYFARLVEIRFSQLS
jgi:hypothetical protein